MNKLKWCKQGCFAGVPRKSKLPTVCIKFPAKAHHRRGTHASVPIARFPADQIRLQPMYGLAMGMENLGP